MSLFAGQAALSAPDTPLVSGDDFAEWFSLGSGTLASLSTQQQNRVQTALEIASADIRNRRRIFTPVTDERVGVDGTGSQSLLLPSNRLPVTGVTLVEELSGTAWVPTDATTYDWSPDGIVQKSGWMCWSHRLQSVRVTYSHGYSTLPRDVAGICLAAAKRLYDQPDSGGGIQSEQLGDHHTTYFAQSNSLLPGEEAVLVAYESRMA